MRAVAGAARSLRDVRLSLQLLPEPFAVCRLDAAAAEPAWLRVRRDVGLCSVTRTADELSIVCADAIVPVSVRAERAFRALRVQGTLDFALVGALEALLRPLAAAGISVFVLSTFDTDWVLVREPALATAVAALRDAGHAVTE
jgi:hypothetical protein